MTKLPQLSHQRVMRALKKKGFFVLRQGKHISMSDGYNLVIIPRQNLIKPGTLRQILNAAGISKEEFNKLI